MTNYPSLLPNNAVALEQRAAEALAEIRRVPIPLRDLLSPERCPEQLLPYLAWAFSVDRWHANWPVETKRKAIKDAYYVHAHKGTIGALRRVVEPLGYALEVCEWWQQEPAGIPGTFSIGIDQGDLPVSNEIQNELVRLIDDAKPVSRQFDYITITGRLLGPNTVAAALVSCDTADLIYPKRFLTDVVPRELALGRFSLLINKMLPEAFNGE